MRAPRATGTGWRPIPLTGNRLVITGGNSMGLGGVWGPGYPAYLCTQMPAQVGSVLNFDGPINIQNAIDRFTTQGHAAIISAWTRGPVVAVLVEGHNSIIYGGVSSADAYTQTVTWAMLYKNAGCKVIVISAVDSTAFASYETARADYNSRLASDGLVHWDALIPDMTALFPVAQRADGIHLTAAQQEQWAAQVATYILSVAP